jgi:hypothetical protein
MAGDEVGVGEESEVLTQPIELRSENGRVAVGKSLAYNKRKISKNRVHLKGSEL